MVRSYLRTAAAALSELANDASCVASLSAMADCLCEAFRNGGKVLLAGNGGSAADCQHLAGELVVRFRADRRALPAIALTVDTSVLTACLNDFGPEPVFARQVSALGREGDVFWAFSTSGTSANILKACEAALVNGMTVIGFTGRSGGDFGKVCEHVFRAPSDVTSHVQECHIAAGHMLCDVIEQRVCMGEE